MTSREYWEARAAWQMHAAMEDAEKVADLIHKAYTRSSDRLGREALRIFEKFRNKYGLSEAEARRLINQVKSKDDIAEILRKLKASGLKIPELIAELESPAYASRLARLARLQRDIDAAMLEMYNLENEKDYDFFVDLANDAYNRSMYLIQQQANAGFSFSHVNRKHIEKMLAAPWSGEHFSKRIWKNTKRLAEELKDEMLVTLLTGRTDREAAHSIAGKFDSGYMQARRLVRTEACRISNEMSMDAYVEAGIEKYRYLATLDLRTSQICRSLDGKEFLVSERKPGTSCPPMHPWCRSTTIAAPTAEELKRMRRRARDPVTGKTYLVPASMTYEEWYEAFVEGRTETEESAGKNNGSLENISRSVKIDGRNRFARLRGALPKEYKEILRDRYNQGTDIAKKIYDKYVPPGGVVANSEYDGTAHYRPFMRDIEMNFKEDQVYKAGPGTTWYHEHGHYIDYKAGLVSQDQDYLDALIDDVKGMDIVVEQKFGLTGRIANYKIKHTLEAIGDISNGVQDIYRAVHNITGDQYYLTEWGHDSGLMNERSCLKESFADMFEASFDPKKVELMKTWLPNSWRVFEFMLEVLL